jgi:hypothetical protein
VIKTVDEKDFLTALMEEGDKVIAEMEAAPSTLRPGSGQAPFRAGSDGARSGPSASLRAGSAPDPVIPLAEIPRAAIGAKRRVRPDHGIA